MHFVFGKTTEHTPAAWWLLLDEESLGYADRVMERALTPYLRGMRSHIATSAEPLFIAASAHLSARMSLRDRLGWYMNMVGGVCPRMATILIERDSEKWPKDRPWTMGDVKLSRYQNGKHWYAVLPDGTEVEWMGLKKWGTAKAAERSAQEYLAALANEEGWAVAVG